MPQGRAASSPHGVLRRGGPADVDALLPMYSEFHAQLAAWVEPDDWRTALETLLAHPSATVWLAQTGDALQGFATLRWRPHGITAVLEDVYVQTAARRQGWGRRLVAAALEEVAARGGREVTLETATSNAASRALYESLGFQRDDQPDSAARSVYRWRRWPAATGAVDPAPGAAPD